MSIFDEPIMIDGKDLSFKRPEEAELIDLEKLCPWLTPSEEQSAAEQKRRSETFLRELIECSEENKNCAKEFSKKEREEREKAMVEILEFNERHYAARRQ